jgi:hypothetical protein
MTMQARDITRALRALLPNVRPLATKTNLSGNGLVLSYTVTMPMPAARNLGLGNPAGQAAVERLLRTHLGTTVRITDVELGRRLATGQNAHITIEREA